MILELISQPLDWPSSGTGPMQELCHDWHGQAFGPPARFSLVEDPDHLWLIAGREKPANAHSMGDCGDFQAELWKHDVAELFIAEPDFKNYLEFNLSPRGAWWAARFSGPRQPADLGTLPEVICHGSPEGSDAWVAGMGGRVASTGGWAASLGIPLDWLRKTIGWGPDSPLNVTFILDSPEQRFLTACDLGGGEPDFHRPQSFQPARRSPEAKP